MPFFERWICIPILVAYLSTINPDVQIWVLLPKGIERTLEHSKGSKKSTKVSKPKSVREAVEKEVMKPVQDPAVQ